MYGLSAMSKQLCEDNYAFLDVVQWRLVKLWFGVSKFASTSSLLNAVECEKGSDLVRTSHETHTALGPVSMSDYTLSCRPNFPTGITRRNIGLLLSNGLHDLFCQSRKCYTPAEGCVCKLCNSPADHKSHIIHCRWATKDEPFDLNVSTVEPLTNDHPHQRPSLSYDHISCDGHWFLFVYESLTSDHPSYTNTPM